MLSEIKYEKLNYLTTYFTFRCMLRESYTTCTLLDICNLPSINPLLIGTLAKRFQLIAEVYKDN